ncbi:MAG: hypothetical protein ACRBBP_08760 [Bdellovibrionales bacterium]
MRTSNPDIEKMMIALGCGTHSKHQLTPQESDPEKQLLKSLKFYWQNSSVFFLIYSSVLKRLYPYIHVDRLVKLAQNSIISSDEKCLLIAICMNLSKKDSRYKIAVKKLHSDSLAMKHPPKNELDKFLIKEWGEESSLKKFGVSARSFMLTKDGKLSPLEKTFKSNTWIKFRALFGPNTRADCAFIMYSSIEELSASEVARRIYSSRQAVSTHYKDFKLLKNSISL